ncbi:hypothetical protein TRVA0_076S00188 [Trichomonascus vanleenenianus]|uniref:glycoside hydrolase family 78 protein n=1 Tax=Trichomonascus vanleenenianus TaxID=2268995 RepID=UPI003ECAB7D4
MTRVSEVLVEYHQKCDTVGIGERKPRLSWKVVDASDGWTQKRYELRITEGRDLVYNEAVESSQSTFVEWTAGPLKSRQRVEVSVRVQGASDSEWSQWSDPIVIEAALLDNSDFKAKFIATSEPKSLREVLFGKQFSLKGGSIARARLYSTAKGVYEVEINGRKVGDEFLSPGWTSYTHRIVQRTDDVTRLLTDGDNAIGIRLADGWFSGLLGFDGGATNVYGDTNMALAQLEVTYEDGSVDVVATDGSWMWTYGPVLSAELYNGETYDATKEIPGWSTPKSDGYSGWLKVTEYPVDVAIEPPVGPPVRCTEIVKPHKIFKSDSGKTIVDFGQNMVGVVRLNKVKAPAGHKVTIYHAEVMENGELGRRPLREAKNVDTYVFKGDSEGEEWAPRFVYHGFRYIQVDNWPGELTVESLDGLVYHTDFQRTGWFSCSHKLLNKLHENVCWSMRGNFVSIPADCPQRDERLGWTGDIMLFGPTANYLYQCQGLLKNWLLDLTAETKDFGAPPIVCPTPLHKYDNFWKGKIVAAWQDAAAIVPWQIYQQTGDLNILRAQYTSMRDWLKQIPRDVNGQLWDPGCFQAGDWLDPDAPPDKPDKTKTDPSIVANCYLIRSTEVVAAAAKLLGEKEDAKKFTDEANALRSLFEKEYMTPSGRMASYSQTAYAIAVMFGFSEDSPEHLEVAGNMLKQIVTMDRFHIGTGFVGTPIICDALVKTGHSDVAYKMLLNEENPSWLYPITMGATTTWERWDSMLPDGKINPGEMTSFNHYALGAVADWMHRSIGGLQCAAPGWKEVVIKPLLGGGISHATTTHDSMFGKISCSWKVVGSKFSLEVVIPANVTGVVHLPDGKMYSVGSGNHFFTADVN